MHRRLAIGAALAVVTAGAAMTVGAAEFAQRPIAELARTATIALARNADWVAITDDAVWVGTKKPNAVQQIDPHTATRTATVLLPGNPCAGLAVGFGSLWVPLCAHPNRLARIDLHSHSVKLLPRLGPAAKEGGITTSPDSVWLVTDAKGILARIDPATGRVRQNIHVPAGSFNPLYFDGRIWLSRADGAEITVIDASTGAVLATVPAGSHPRFLTAGAGAVWTLNQGDGSLSRIDAQSLKVTSTVALQTPGPGGDITFADGMIWTTMQKVPLSGIDAAAHTLRCQWAGPGGDSLAIGHGAIWLTDYDAGTLSRIELKDAVSSCRKLVPDR